MNFLCCIKKGNLAHIIANENVFGTYVIKTDPIDDEENAQQVDEFDGFEVEVRKTKKRSKIGPTSVSANEMSIPIYPKSAEDQAAIKSAFQKNEFLNQIMDEARLKAIIDATYSQTVSAAEKIITEGDKGFHIYISSEGTFEITIKGEVVKRFSDHQVFGELAILYDGIIRQATVKATTPGKIWVLDGDVFKQIMVQLLIEEENVKLQFLRKVEHLNTLDEPILLQVVKSLQTEFFPSGTEIVRQGDRGNTVYIIRVGSVTVTKKYEGIVATLKEGEYFGETAILKEDCRQATVTADPGGVECLTLERHEFIQYYLNTPTKSELARSSEAVVEYRDLRFDDLRIWATLGEGGFGRVELVRHRTDSKLFFALKYMNKVDIVANKLQTQVFNERDIMMKCNNPFIIRLYRTYKDERFVFFLLEACLGGDVCDLMVKQKRQRFSEKQAKFIVACSLEALDYLHKKNVIFRDLKPENLLVDSKGYVKLADFGCAKKLSARTRSLSLVGTPEYIAPEMVSYKDHDRAVDYWALGILVHELLSGRTPFYGGKTLERIVRGLDQNALNARSFSAGAKKLIRKLCSLNPVRRLGMGIHGAEDVKSHEWFTNFKWKELEELRLVSPLPVVAEREFPDIPQKGRPDVENSGWDEHF